MSWLLQQLTRTSKHAKAQLRTALVAAVLQQPPMW